MAVDSIPSRLIEQATQRPYGDAYAVRTASGWVKTTWTEYVDQVKEASRALMALGLQNGGMICILGFNRPEWVITDLAAMMTGGVPAGIYTTCSSPEVAYIIQHSGAEIVLVENTMQWEKVKEERANLPNLKHVILMKGADSVDDPMVLSWEAFLAKSDGVTEDQLTERMDSIQMDQLATLIYTSGTTGPPKAVMLSHENLSWTAEAAREIADFTDNDTCLSYLPLSHIAEQMFSIHGPVSHGILVYYAESLEKLPDNLKEVQPTIVFGVPRVWEKFHAGVSSKLAKATGVKAKLVSWARGVGTRVTDLRNRGGEPTGLLAVQYKLANKLIYSKVKPLLGLKNARMCVSGAAPIAPEILEFFGGLDLTIHEVYGQSEDCGPTSFNVPGQTKFGSVGPAVPGVQIRIADDGEILVKGPNVFMGYYKDPAATADSLIDGWLHSGDLGSFDDDGFLFITGRKKEIIITAGGKNIAPKNIEAALKNQDLIAEAVVIGDRRKFLTALLTLDEDATTEFASENNLANDNVIADAKLRAHIQSGVDTVNEMFARVEHVRKFTVLPRNFSIEDGELTPTQKIKRRVIHDKYSDEIEAMYVDA